MSGGRNWMTSEARKLRELRAEGVRVPVIAGILGRTEHSVYSFLRYNHVPQQKSEARHRHCPHCGAKAGEQCFRVRPDRGDGRRKTFHTERLSA
jgi:hypothetical protein